MRIVETLFGVIVLATGLGTLTVGCAAEVGTAEPQTVERLSTQRSGRVAVSARFANGVIKTQVLDTDRGKILGTIVFDAKATPERELLAPSAKEEVIAVMGRGSLRVAGHDREQVFAAFAEPSLERWNAFAIGLVEQASGAPKALSCGSGWNEPLVPDGYGCADYTGACTTHDNCYGTCGASKNACDYSFLQNMESACDDAYGPCGSGAGCGSGSGSTSTSSSGCSSSNPTNPSYDPDARRDCYARAQTYYGAVQDWGGGPYNDAQAAACGSGSGSGSTSTS